MAHYRDLIGLPKGVDLDAPPPPGYVAGVGRGATGFTTRSDIGPARTAGDVSDRGRRNPNEKKEEMEDLSDAQYDKFSGYSQNLFAGAQYTKEDEEADKIFAAVDKRIERKKETKRKEKIEAAAETYRSDEPSIQQQFADLKRQLSQVSEEEWNAIPEIGDYSLRHKRRRQERFTPVPDSLLEQAKIEAEGRATSTASSSSPYSGLDTPLSAGFATPAPDLNQFGQMRKQMLQIEMKKREDSVTGQTVVNPKGYLTDLKSVKTNSFDDVQNIKKATELLNSLIETNPKHAPAWVAAARAYAEAQNMVLARRTIQRGCEAVPESEDVWLENIRLQSADNAKIVMARAVKAIPRSVRLWAKAVEMEPDQTKKKKILRQALLLIPKSVRLWKTAVEYEEDEDDARTLLSRAVECVPTSVEMWLALARLETYKNARAVLNKARQAIPTEASIWITAAKLEEANGAQLDMVRSIVKKALKSLAAHQVVIDRDKWITYAEDSEKSESVLTCQAIIKETIGMDVEDEDRKRTWLDDAEACIANGSVQTARAIYAHALTVFPGKKGIWMRFAMLERDHGTRESLDGILKEAVRYCPQAEILWLMAAKETWQAGDLKGARTILSEAFKANPDSSRIWLAAAKLEWEGGKHSKARDFLKQARERASTPVVWMKSALLEREVGDRNAERVLLEGGLKKYPDFAKMWMMLGQNAEFTDDAKAASTVYMRGLKKCSRSVPLWLCAARNEVTISVSKARSLLERARMLCPKSPELWREAIRIEQQADNDKIAATLMAKSLQECPTSGLLWAHAISLEPPAARKTRALDALTKCGNDKYVMLEVTKIFARDRKFRKARSRFNRTIALDPDFGDAWAYYLKFEAAHGTPETREKLMKRCARADPKHGEEWVKVSKDPEIIKKHLSVEQILREVAKRLPHL